MKKFSKLTMAALLVLLLTLMFSAILPVAVEARSTKPITITWWINPWRILPPGYPEDAKLTGEEFAKWISGEFMKLYPNVTVKYEIITNQGLEQKIAAAILAGNPPDVFRPLALKSVWAKQGLLEPIENYLSAEDRKDYYDYALNVGKVDGHYYMFPWNNSNNGMGSTLLANPTIFKERGVSLPPLPDRGWTVDEFLAAARKLTFDRDGDGKIDVYALSFPSKDLYVMMGWMSLFGARLTNAGETEFTLNSPEGVRALQFIVDLVYKYKVAPEGGEGMGIYDAINLFHQKKTALGYGGPYEIGRIDRYVTEGKLKEAFPVKIVQYPHDPRVGPFAYHTSGGFIVFKQNDPEKREMALKFADFVTNRENTRLLKSLMYITARKSVNKDLYKGSPFEEDVQVYVRALEHGIRYLGSSDLDTQPIEKHLEAMFQAALSRNKTPKQALDDFVREADRIVFKK